MRGHAGGRREDILKRGGEKHLFIREKESISSPVTMAERSPSGERGKKKDHSSYGS